MTLAAAQECMRQTQQRSARNYEKRRSADFFYPGGVVLLDSQTRRDTHERDLLRKSSAHSVGTIAILSLVNIFAYAVSNIDTLPPLQQHKMLEQLRSGCLDTGGWVDSF